MRRLVYVLERKKKEKRLRFLDQPSTTLPRSATNTISSAVNLAHLNFTYVDFDVNDFFVPSLTLRLVWSSIREPKDSPVKISIRDLSARSRRRAFDDDSKRNPVISRDQAPLKRL